MGYIYVVLQDYNVVTTRIKESDELSRGAMILRG
jgi:hypothetical protein